MNLLKRSERSREVLNITGDSLLIEDVVNVSRKGQAVALDEEALQRVIHSRTMLEKLVESNAVVYGITTGFGRFSDVNISRKDAIQLQKNLIASHATAVGDPLPEETVRAALLLRINALSRGCSGVRPQLLERLIAMLNLGVVPVIPEQGSLGASGDLAPLSHLALVVTGEGEAYFKGERMSGAEALAAAGLEPVTLVEKEGLALINGTQVMTAIGTLAYYDAVNLLKASMITAALTLEAQLAVPDAFDPLIGQVRAYRGHQYVSEMIRCLITDSKLIGSDTIKVQDSYSLRCIPQVHGATADALDYVRSIIEVEINSVNDNPLLFPDEGKVLSGGNFHGQPVAQAMDFMAIAVAELASIAERRVEQLVNPALSSLPPFLVKEGGLNSGLMIAQYTAASLVSENKVLCHPASVDSIPSSANQEDHVSMGTTAARKARKVVDNVASVLGIELLAAAQAVDFRGAENLGCGTAAAHRLLRQEVDFIEKDVVLYPLVNRAIELVKSGRLVEAVDAEVNFC
ncbi:MAG: histidine ammonia-lyase [Firmicutes bacterium]|nr:histidine ammonia-lyase [Bacillota bacterium]